MAVVARRLNLHALSGTIPPSWTKLRQLRRLHLGFNRLEGTIPVGIESMDRLEFLDLQSNRLSGSVPVLPPALRPAGAAADHAVPLRRRLLLGGNDKLLGATPIPDSSAAEGSEEAVAGSARGKGRRAKRKAAAARAKDAAKEGRRPG